MKTPRSGNTLFLMTLLVMIAFAANSVLNRAALSYQLIDPYSFTTVRLLSGALCLWLLSLLNRQSGLPSNKQLIPQLGRALLLLGYALLFSVAYLAIDSGTGALLLFASVQITILLYSHCFVQRLSKYQWMGSAIAFSGLVYLFLPGLNAPDPFSSLLMILAGICWGGFTLAGMQARQSGVAPLQNMQRSFLYATPLAFIISLAVVGSTQTTKMTGSGLALAVLAGAITSGLGYWLWYRILPQLSASIAASSQLSVPVLASLGGWLFLAEKPDSRIIIAMPVILLGIILSGKKTKKPGN